MNLKRTMSQALHTGNLSGEAAAFIAGGVPGNAAASATPPDLSSSNGTPVPEAATPPLTPGQNPPTTAAKPPESPTPAGHSAPVSMTFRLPADLPEALMRAAMERKLRHEEPFTQQDIVAQAVREWLERNVTRG